MKSTPKIAIIKTRHGHEIWNVCPELEEIALPIARRLKISLLEFLTRLSSGCYLSTKGPVDRGAEPAPAGFFISMPEDEDLRRWIERGARAVGKSVTDLAWEALASHTDCVEEGMIFDSAGNCVLDHTDELASFRKRVHGQLETGGADGSTR